MREREKESGCCTLPERKREGGEGGINSTPLGKKITARAALKSWRESSNLLLIGTERVEERERETATMGEGAKETWRVREGERHQR